MKILFIASGFAPYSFSENIVNSKLVLAMIKKGWKVDVISKKDEGVAYSSTWDSEWKDLEKLTHEVTYETGNKITKIIDTLKCMLQMASPIEGVRWANKAYKKALELHKINNYDVVISRTPSDISHLPAYHFSKKTGVKWIANWNDPCIHIWPEPYVQNIPSYKKFIYKKYMNDVIKTATINSFPSQELMIHFKNYTSNLNTNNSAIIPHIGFLELNFENKNQENRTLKLFHAGNLSYERNPEIIFKAFKNLLDKGIVNNIQIDLLGVQNQYTKKLIEKYNLSNHVKMLGSLPYIKALEFMSSYDILMIVEAKLKNGIFLPSKVVDYSQLNVPIWAITPKNSCIDKYLQNCGGGISSDNGSLESIEKGLLELDSAKKGNTLNSFKPDSLFDNFSTNTIIKKYENIFEGMNLND
jgi:glycosyltransferase involved in cell wall biosynthesis